MESTMKISILVGGFSPTPLKNMSSSIGMMTFPMYGKIKVNRIESLLLEVWNLQ